MIQNPQRSSQPLDVRDVLFSLSIDVFLCFQQRNFTSAFLLLFAGTVIATITLTCENGYSRFITRAKRTANEKEDRETRSYKPMNLSNGNPREKFLEKRIENLQERIRELEAKLRMNFSSKPFEIDPTTNTAYLVLPVTYTPEEERSSVLEIVSHPSDNPLLLVEQSNARVYETIV